MASGLKRGRSSTDLAEESSRKLKKTVSEEVATDEQIYFRKNKDQLTPYEDVLAGVRQKKKEPLFKFGLDVLPMDPQSSSAEHYAQ